MRVANLCRFEVGLRSATRFNRRALTEKNRKQDLPTRHNAPSLCFLLGRTLPLTVETGGCSRHDEHHLCRFEFA